MGSKKRKKPPTEVVLDTGRVLVGSCLERLKELDDASVDAIVTDPPYELGFMGKAWDASGIAYNVDLWRECLRVLKPGGHLLAFGGTRTYHRMAVAIEDAGFEIRDSIHWLYGSGFPKSLDVSKAIDKQRHDRDDVYRVTAWVRAARDAAGISNRDIDAAFGTNGMAGHWTSSKSQPAVPTLDQVQTLLDALGVKADDVPEDIRRLLWDLNGHAGEPGKNWAKREVVGERVVPIGHSFAGPTYGGDSSSREVAVTAPATDAAKQWSGWGTALKPAHEPIVVARKPLAGTVAATVQEHGTGAINIDGCRVGVTSATRRDGKVNAGRWPANSILTHSAECEQVGTRTDTFSVVAGLRDYPQDSNFGARAQVHQKPQETEVPIWSCVHGCPVAELDRQSDGASRFFTVTEWDELDGAPFLYVAKPNKAERNAGLDGLPKKVAAEIGAVRGRCQPCGRWADPGEGTNCGKCGARFERTSNARPPQANTHPTVKPVELMRHLVRLVTPPDGLVLDPFLGSGTTAVAAVLESKRWVGCELTADYLSIIEGRVKHAEKQVAAEQPSLFES